MWGCDAPKELLVMQRKWIVIAAAVIAAWPAGLDAQRTPRPPRPPRAPRAYAYSYSTENRGRIGVGICPRRARGDRKSTRLNSSHDQISYAVFCLKKKNKYNCVTLSA